MLFKKEFYNFSRIKGHTLGRRINSVPEYDAIINNNMKSYLKNVINRNDLIINSSVGIGIYSDVPWIGLLSSNAKISPSIQKGIYVVLLFNKKGDSFYLALSQGMSFFRKMDIKPKMQDEIIQNTVNYFRENISKHLVEKVGFTTELMDLGDGLTFRGKSYIRTTIISKKYNVFDFDPIDFKQSLNLLLDEYFDILDHIGNQSYEDIVFKICPIDDFVHIDVALETLAKTLDKYMPIRDINKKAIKVKKGDSKPIKYNKIMQPKIYDKIDYIDKAREDLQIGAAGEELALIIERDRLISLNLDPNKYIKWISKESDSYGYDLESVDFRDDKLVKIFIEVKTTKDIKDTPFFVSKNQVNISKIKKKQYRILRIFDIASIIPKYYFADGEIEENFHLDPVTYSATYKFNIAAI